MLHEIDLRKQEFSFLGKGSKVKGDLHLHGETRFFGKLEGNIHLEGDSPLIIERQAEIEGNVYAHQIEVYGKVKGKVESSNHVTFHAGATFEGEIISPKLKVNPGAVLEMVCNTLES